MHLTIIRGAPGSGKTTLACLMSGDFALAGLTVSHREADQFMVDESGKYNFVPSRLPEVHRACQSAVESDMQRGVEEVIVSNTFTKLWELEKYVFMAWLYGYTISVVQCTGTFENEHGVPKERVEVMRSIYEPTLRPERPGRDVLRDIRNRLQNRRNLDTL